VELVPERFAVGVALTHALMEVLRAAGVGEGLLGDIAQRTVFREVRGN
jgi:hypothetical protein